MLYGHALLVEDSSSTNTKKFGAIGVNNFLIWRTFYTISNFGKDNGPPHAYIYRPSRLVEEVADSLVALGDPPEKIRTERFGPSG